MLYLIELLVRLAVFFAAAGLLIGVLCAAASTILHLTGAAFGFGFYFVRGACANAAKFIGELVTDQVASLVGRGRPSREAMQARIISLEHDLASAQGKAAALARRVEELGAELKSIRPSVAARLYSEVGLHPDAEEFLLRAARQAYRKHYHPDVCRSVPPEIATQRFQQAERSFELIWSQRGI